MNQMPDEEIERLMAVALSGDAELFETAYLQAMGNIIETNPEQMRQAAESGDFYTQKEVAFQNKIIIDRVPEGWRIQTMGKTAVVEHGIIRLHADGRLNMKTVARPEDQKSNRT